MRFRLLLTTASLVISMVVAAGCAPSGGSAGGAGSGSSVTVTVSEFAFKPAALTLKVGQRYTVRLQNQGQVLHDWTVDAIPVQDVTVGTSAAHSMSDMGVTMAPEEATQLHVAADRGKAADVSFTPTKAGEYVFYCTVPGHREAGMQGKLMVGS